MICTRCETQHQKNVTHCVVCNFLIDHTEDMVKESQDLKYKLETDNCIQNSSTHEEYTVIQKCNIKKHKVRSTEKKGINDLKKARCYLDKWIEVEQLKKPIGR